MNNEQDRNYVSAGTWMLILFITAVPIAGILALGLLFGMGGGLVKRLHSWTHKA
jgi:hypothetical protein